MITITFPKVEYYNDSENLFEELPETKASFEYSLKAIMEWESRWKVPYMATQMTIDDPRLIDFLKCMCVEEDLHMLRFVPEIVSVLVEYINDSHTATAFNSSQNGPERPSKTYTAEEIYAIMFMNQIPLELETRNLNNLLVILRIISIYNNPPKKMSRQEILSQNARLNAERRAKLGTKG